MNIYLVKNWQTGPTAGNDTESSLLAPIFSAAKAKFMADGNFTFYSNETASGQLSGTDAISADCNKKMTEGVYVSLHGNAAADKPGDKGWGGATGCTGFYLAENAEAGELCKKIINALSKIENASNRSAKIANTRMNELVKTKVKNATLIECGFMDNTAQYNHMKANATLYGKTIYDAVCDFCGFKTAQDTKGDENNMAYQLITDAGFRTAPDKAFVFGTDESRQYIPTGTLIAPVKTQKSGVGTLWGYHFWNGAWGWTVVDTTKGYAKIYEGEIEPKGSGDSGLQAEYNNVLNQLNDCKARLSQIKGLSSV